jgi:hypothetical protein
VCVCVCVCARAWACACARARLSGTKYNKKPLRLQSAGRNRSDYGSRKADFTCVTLDVFLHKECCEQVDIRKIKFFGFFFCDLCSNKKFVSENAKRRDQSEYLDVDMKERLV